MLRIAFAIAVAAVLLLVPAAPAGTDAQRTIALPDEFRPEGIASGPKSTFFAGSIPHAVNARFDRPDDSDADVVRLHARR